jgi:hypothetical protein
MNRSFENHLNKLDEIFQLLKETTYKSMATSPPFVQLKPSSLDLYLPDKESNRKSKRFKQLSRSLQQRSSNKSTPLLAWSTSTRTILHVTPTYSHHLLHLSRKVPNSSGQTIVNTALMNSNALLQNKWSLLILTSPFHLKSTWMHQTNKLD